jgi:hypothetical protein
MRDESDTAKFNLDLSSDLHEFNGKTGLEI